MARKNPPRHPPLPQAVATRCHLLLFLSSFLARGYVLLIISTVSRGADILASHTTGRRDFSNAVTTILGKIPPNDSKPTYLWKQNISSTMSLRARRTSFLRTMWQAEDCPLPTLPRFSFHDLSRVSLNSSSGHSSYLICVMQELIEERVQRESAKGALQMSHSEPDQVKDIMVHNRIELLVDKTHYLCVHLWFIRPRLFANRCRCSLPSIITFVGDNYSPSLSLRIARHRLRALRAPCCVIPAPTLVRRLTRRS
ncbi:hypothetical protein BKA62DRAFT_727735 [Auriculariales sp. MPI-PUGE-AT-0066]|nr:hypothetical protein BKA62DRAFT_727735 [Auriculariales sp. MPI-PUGE-AT-0066]